MTDAQRVQLIREIAEQAMTGQLSDQEAMTAIVLVLEPGGLSHDQVAILVRGRVAHLGD